MLRTTGLALCALLPLALSLGHAPALGQDDSAEFWLTVSASAPVGADGLALVEISPRQRREVVGGDQLLMRASYDHTITPRFALGGGLTHVLFDNGSETRPHQQVTLTLGAFALRTRFEQRFFDGSPRAAFRLRQRIQWSHPLDRDTRIVALAEGLWRVRADREGGRTGTDQRRVGVQLQQGLGGGFTGTLGYLLIDIPRPGRDDRFAHVPQLTLNWRPAPRRTPPPAAPPIRR